MSDQPKPDLKELKRLVTAWRDLHVAMEDRRNIGKLREFDRAGRDLYRWLYHNVDAMIEQQATVSAHNARHPPTTDNP